MELVSKYVYEVYKAKSFSAAAKELYISQPALSTAVSRLEKELGIRIFDRSKQPLSLTPQGRVYIQSLEEIMESESKMRQKIREMSDMSYGTLTIGGSSSVSYYAMSDICGAFYKKYPDIKVHLDIGNVGSRDILWEKLDSDEIDLVVTYTNDNHKYIIEPLLTVRYLVVMRKDCLETKALEPYALTRDEFLSGDFDKSREIEDLSIFKDISFVDYGNSLTGKIMTQLLGDYKRAPYKIHNARHGVMHYNLMCAGVGAVLTTDSVVSKMPYEAENLYYFVMKSKYSYRTVYLARKHSSDENPIVKNFIKVAKQVCGTG